MDSEGDSVKHKIECSLKISTRNRNTLSTISKLVYLLALLLVLASCGRVEEEVNLEVLLPTLNESNYYLVHFHDQPIGRYETSGSYTDDEPIAFSSSLVLPIVGETVLRTETRYQFEATPPYALLEVVQSRYDDSPMVNTEYAGFGLQFGGNKSDDSMNLRDLFALELFALDSKLHRNQQKIISSLSLHPSIAVNHEAWTADQVDEQRVHFSNSAGKQVTFEVGNELPILLSMSHPDGLSFSKKALAELNQTTIPIPEFDFTQGIPVSSPLENPRNTSRLVLKLNFENAISGIWEQHLSADSTISIDAESKKFTSNRLHWPTSRLSPVEAEKLFPAAMQLRAWSDDENEILDILVYYLNQSLSYQVTPGTQPLSKTIELGTGDCADYARLLNGFAEMLGFRSRMVLGLVYDDRTKSFRPHAWNEVGLSDDSYRLVDSTWGQYRADATHLEFPDAFMHEIVNSLMTMSIDIVEAEYFSEEAAE